MANKKPGAVWKADVPSFAELLESGVFADAEIHLGDRKWKIHKMVVCSQSKYFEATFTGKFEEASTGVLRLDEAQWDEQDINALLQFLYTGAMNTAKLFPSIENDSYSILMKVWVVADYFQATKLLHLVAKLRDARIISSTSALREQSSIASRGPKHIYLQHPILESKKVLAAISRLQIYMEKGKAGVVTEFHPTLMRVILCSRDLFPLKDLCKDYPDFVKGWEILFDETGLSFESPSAPQPKQYRDVCQKCGIRYQLCSAEPRTKWMLDPMAGGMDCDGGCAEWLCGGCYKVPTLEDWELVREMVKLKKEQNAIKTRMALIKSCLRESRLRRGRKVLVKDVQEPKH